MSRPKPEVIMENIDRKTFTSKQVLKSDSLYVVLYDGQPFNMRSVDYARNNPPHTYCRIGYAAEASAINKARRLNVLYNTTKFAAYKVDLSAVTKLKACTCNRC